MQHVARIGQRRVTYMAMVEKGTGNNLQNLGIDGNIILEWIFKEIG